VTIFSAHAIYLTVLQLKWNLFRTSNRDKKTNKIK